MIWNIVEIILFVLGLLLFTAMIIANISLRIENKKLKTNLTQESIDRAVVMEKLKEVMARQDSSISAQTEGFLKFVSESRDAAFKYIEEVQSAISEFDHRLGPVVKHYRETGKVLEKRPTEIIKNVSEAYDKLMESMPKENNV